MMLNKSIKPSQIRLLISAGNTINCVVHFSEFFGSAGYTVKVLYSGIEHCFLSLERSAEVKVFSSLDSVHKTLKNAGVLQYTVVTS